MVVRNELKSPSEPNNVDVKIRNKFTPKEGNIESVVDDDYINLFESTEAAESHLDFFRFRYFSKKKLKFNRYQSTVE